MDLRMQSRSHAFDRLWKLFGSRLIVLDVWIEASPDEVAKLKDFNMMKRKFFSTSEMKTGAVNIAFGLLMAAVAWTFYQTIAEPFAYMAIAGGLSGLGLLSATQVAGKEGQLVLKVEDTVNCVVPFTFDNPADLHQLREFIGEQYQGLFGAMYEIEHFGEVHETVWDRDAEAMA